MNGTGDDIDINDFIEILVKKDAMLGASTPPAGEPVEAYYGGVINGEDVVFCIKVYPKNHPDKNMGWLLLDKENRMEIIDFLEARGVTVEEYADNREGNYWFKFVPVDKSPVRDKKVAIANMLRHVKENRSFNFRGTNKMKIEFVDC